MDGGRTALLVLEPAHGCATQLRHVVLGVTTLASVSSKPSATA